MKRPYKYGEGRNVHGWDPPYGIGRKQTAIRGFSVSEALLLLTVLCLVLVLGLQWFMKWQTGAPMDVIQQAGHIVSMELAGLAGDGVKAQSTPDGVALSSSGNGNSWGPAAMQDGLVLRFGTDVSVMEVFVPGRVVVSNMPVGQDGQEVAIHWFHPRRAE